MSGPGEPSGAGEVDSGAGEIGDLDEVGGRAVTTATVTRARHPLVGQRLRVLGQVRRGGCRQLLLALPDGSKSLLPASWTDRDAAEDAEDAQARPEATLGSLADLTRAAAVVAAWRAVKPGQDEQAAWLSPCERDSHATHPAQSAGRPAADASTDDPRRASPTRGRRRGVEAGEPDRQGRQQPSRRGGRGL